MQALTTLHLDCYEFELDSTIDEDFAFLTTFPALHKLTLAGLNGVNDSLLAAMLKLSQLQQLSFIELSYWEWSAAHIGRLRAEMAVKRPSCSITASWPEFDA